VTEEEAKRAEEKANREYEEAKEKAERMVRKAREKADAAHDAYVKLIFERVEGKKRLVW